LQYLWLISTMNLQLASISLPLWLDEEGKSLLY